PRRACPRTRRPGGGPSRGTHPRAAPRPRRGRAAAAAGRGAPPGRGLRAVPRRRRQLRGPSHADPRGPQPGPPPRRGEADHRPDRLRGRRLDARLEGKLRFWELADPVSDVLYGIEHGMPDVRDEGVDLLTTLLAP